MKIIFTTLEWRLSPIYTRENAVRNIDAIAMSPQRPSFVSALIERQPFVLNYIAHSDAGLARLKNQDAWKIGCDNRLFALADGIGGRKAGEIASKWAVDFLCSWMERSRAKFGEMARSETSALLQNAIHHTNGQIFEMGCRDDQRQGMGTTLCCLYQCKNMAYYAHVGDSRIYLWRKNRLIQLTQDHSFKQSLDFEGDQVRNAPRDYLKSILTRAIGVRHRVSPTIGTCALQTDDRFLLCSDGLTDVLSPQEIKQTLARPYLNQNIARELIESAKNKGSRDNITAVLIQVSALNEVDLFRQ